MITRLLTLLVLATCVLESASGQTPEFPKPVAEHEWLKRFEGTWTSESKGTAGPGQPEMQCNGTMNCRLLGGFWVVNEWNTKVPGATMQGIQTIGFDTSKKKYVGTWVDNMMNHMWHYEGTVVDGKKLILEAKGPNFMSEGKETMFRDSYEFVRDDEIKVTSEMQGEDGKWITFMAGTAKRQIDKK